MNDAISACLATDERQRWVRRSRGGPVHPLALLAASLLHAAVIVLMLRSGVAGDQPPSPTPELTIAVEVSPAAASTTPSATSATSQPAESQESAAPAAPSAAVPAVAAIRAPDAEIQALPPVPQPPPPVADVVQRPNRTSKPIPHVSLRAKPQAAVASPRATADALPRSSEAASPAHDSATDAIAGSGAKHTWEGDLSAWIQAHKSYPEVARVRHEEGTVTLTFVVARDGHVKHVALARSSGSGTLDNAAVGILSNALVPPFPESMSQTQMTVTVALRYSIER